MKYKYLICYQYTNYTGEHFLSSKFKVLEHEITEEDIKMIEKELAETLYYCQHNTYPQVMSFSRLAMSESDDNGMKD